MRGKNFHTVFNLIIIIMAHNESEGFYVTLPSNASNELFKSNASSCYTMDLAKPIELSGEWMVGLCEFVYPRTWYNLPPDNAYFELNRTTDEPQPLISVKFSRGGYNSRPKDVLDHVVARVREYNPTFHAS